MDEVQHSYFQTLVVRQIMTELDEELTDKEKTEIAQFIYDMFTEIVNGEKELAQDMYTDITGINLKEVEGYIEWRANLLLQNLGLDKIFETKSNPMRWINTFDPEYINNTKTDFFHGRVTNYSKPVDFDDL